LALIDALTTRTIFAQGETVVSWLIALNNNKFWFGNLIQNH
jgi:hypothetical protein